MTELIGKTIDNYQIEALIGRGGVGSVYKATDLGLDRVVALKLLDPLLADDPEVMRRFLREPKLQAKLEHANIVRVHSFRRTSVGLFMVMEYVDGTTLTDLINQHVALPVEKVMGMFKQMLAAIRHAHAVNIIHRDIKPGNVMIARNGIVKITDFGLAKLTRNGQTTVTNSITGTVHYMSPEQVRGLYNADQRSDIYSLGMTLYEMLTGKLPFSDKDNDYVILKAIIEQEYTPPTSHNRDIPGWINDAVMKSLRKEADERFQTIEEFSEALQLTTSFYQPAAKEDPRTLPPNNTNSATIFAGDNTAGRAEPPSAEVQPVAEAGYAEVDTQPVPDNTPEYVYESPRNKGLLWALALIAVVAMLGVLYFILPVDDAPTPVQTDMAAIIVNSDPPGATIVIDGQAVGTTPYRNDSLSLNSNLLQLELDGHKRWRRTLAALQRGETHHFNAMMEEVAETKGQLSITSEPNRAQVWINDKAVGYTPFSNDSLDEGDYAIKLVKTGYASWQTHIALHPGTPSKIHAPLAIAGMSHLQLGVHPGGDIYVDGTRRGTSFGQRLDIDVPSGTHRIKFENSNGKHHEIRVTLDAGKSRDITCYFEEYVNIQTLNEDGESIWASILVNGKSINQTSPFANLPLSVGTHTISVQRRGYATRKGSQQLIISPGFEKKTHSLVFTLQKEAS